MKFSFKAYSLALVGSLVLNHGSDAALIGYWSFDDQLASTADLSPGGNAGTVNGATFVVGHTGNASDFALSFNGSSNSVTTGVALLNGLSELTMSGWVQFPSAQGNRTGLFGQNDIMEFGMINSTTLQQWNPASGAINTAFGPAVNDWTHIAVVGGPGGRTTYIGGLPFSTAAGGLSGNSNGFGFNIGGSGIFDAGGNWFNGLIDDVAVWDHQLTPYEIATLASGGVHTPLVIPEPSRALMLLGGIAGLLIGRRKR
jgi:hypothetical protein